MRYFPNRIIAKSTAENFDKEYSGYKNCTVREVDSSERKALENFWTSIADEYVFSSEKYITIESTESGNSFVRTITDISFFKSYHDGGKEIHIYIISFKNPGEVQEVQRVDCSDRIDSTAEAIRMLHANYTRRI